jgi:hypothetical protein
MALLVLVLFPMLLLFGLRSTQPLWTEKLPLFVQRFPIAVNAGPSPWAAWRFFGFLVSSRGFLHRAQVEAEVVAQGHTVALAGAAAVAELRLIVPAVVTVGEDQYVVQGHISDNSWFEIRIDPSRNPPKMPLQSKNVEILLS